MSNVDGSNVRPARDLSEREARERLAKEHERYAEVMESAVNPEYRKRAPYHRAIAQSLRVKAP